ncbi:class II holin family protein [Escherichia coli]
MKSMDKLTTGVAYGTSAGSAGYWFLQLLDKVTPSQWAAIGVLGSLVFGLLTYLTNLYFKGNDSNLLIVFYVQIMPDDFVMQLHRF